MYSSFLQSPQRRWRYWVLRLLLLGGAVVLGLVAAELAVRLLGIDHPGQETGVVPHPLWHHWHRPDFSFGYAVPAENIVQPIHFNHHGMRDRDRRAEKPSEGTLRIAVLGDSFVEALQVGEDEMFTRRLEAELRGSLSEDVEVLNWGCSGFSSILELLLLRAWVDRFEPDLVICLHHFSDPTEDWRFGSLAVCADGTWQAVPARGQGMSREIRRVLEHSQLFRVSAAGVNRFRRHRPPSPDASLQESFDAIVHDPYTPEDEVAWRNSLRALGEMADLLHERDIPFLIVLIPLGPQVEPVPPAFASQVGYRYLADGRRLEGCKYQTKVQAFCRDKEIPCLDLLPVFRTANPSGRQWLYLPRDQHWTAAGHARAASAVAAQVREHPPRPRPRTGGTAAVRSR